MWKRTSALLALVGLALATGTAGSLDASFDTDGVVIATHATEGQLQGVAVQSDGKVVAVGGEGYPTTPQRWRIRRFLADGSADTAFDTAADVGLDGGVARRVAIDPTGRIVVAGFTKIQKVVKGKTTTVNVTALVRLLSDGSLDTTFGNAGKVLAEPYVGISAPVVLQADGKILVAGGSGGGVAIQRFQGSGALDTGFGNGGTMIDDVRRSTGGLPALDDAWGIAVQSSGRIVAGCSLGATRTDPAVRWALRRYMADGTLDTSFGSSGMTTSAGDALDDIAVDSLDRIVAAGSTLDAQQIYRDEGLVVRYTSAGAVDSSFGSGGEFLTGIAGIDEFHRVSVLAGDRIMLLGRGSSITYVARLDADGAPDTTFGGDGFGDAVQFGSSGGMAVDAAGNPVAGGMYDTYAWLLARWCGN